MSAWTWVLLAGSAGGALLALVSLFPVLGAAMRLRARADDLRNARLFIAMDSLRRQGARFARLNAQLAQLRDRAMAAMRTGGLP